MDGEKCSDGWVIENSSWDTRSLPNEKIIVTIIFEVESDLQSEMTVDEYAEYFVKNYIKVTGSCKNAKTRNGEIIKNNNAELTLNSNEQEIKNFTIVEDLDFDSPLLDEKQYIVDVYNDTDYDFSKIRGNIYYGNGNKLMEVSPSEITCNHGNNSTFELPFWINLPSKEKITFYFIIKTTEENFIPDIIMSGTVQ